MIAQPAKVHVDIPSLGLCQESKGPRDRRGSVCFVVFIAKTVLETVEYMHSTISSNFNAPLLPSAQQFSPGTNFLESISGIWKWKEQSDSRAPIGARAIA